MFAQSLHEYVLGIRWIARIDRVFTLFDCDHSWHPMVLPSALLLDLKIVGLIGFRLYVNLMPVTLNSMGTGRDLGLEKHCASKPCHFLSIEKKDVLLA